MMARSSVTVTLDINRDPDLATVDIENRVNTAQGRLPAAVKAIGITTAKSSQNFVFGAAIISDSNKYSTLFMSNYLDIYVRDALKRIPGVADVIIFGERKSIPCGCGWIHGAHGGTGTDRAG